MSSFLRAHSYAGKVTLPALTIGGVAIMFGLFVYFESGLKVASASDVTTSVTVLNTAPAWTVNAEEGVESSYENPTNTGTAATWTATGTDSSNDNYFLLICMTDAAPTPNPLAPPTCGGGNSNQWAVSPTTTSGVQATAATTTTELFPEENVWYAWICDAHADLPRCNTEDQQGSGNTASPFIVNYPPVFVSVNNDSPVNPDDEIEWSTVAYSMRTVGDPNLLTLYVCETAGFTPGVGCSGDMLAVTDPAVATNPVATTTIPLPFFAGMHDAFVYLVDRFDHAATSTVQGFNSEYEVNNMTPVVDASTIEILNYDPIGETWALEPIVLFEASSTSGPYRVDFEVSDDNGCINAASDPEMVFAKADIYRSGVTQASCNAAGHYNANSCYVHESPLTDISCSQTSCLDETAQWSCTFSLWFLADPTDGASTAQSPWFAETWLASVQVSDWMYATSTNTQTTAGGSELNRFLAFEVTQTAIGYDALEPGDESPLNQVTDLIAVGNVGLDQTLYGDTMCTTWTEPDSCDPVDPTSTIAVNNQQFATSSLAYDHIDALSLTSSTSPATLLINVPKSVATNTPQTRDTFWGIRVPGTITVAGDYEGQNTLTAIISNGLNW